MKYQFSRKSYGLKRNHKYDKRFPKINIIYDMTFLTV